jgi:hypothetical protein
MKKLLIFITIVAVNIMYSQEQKTIKELNPPLNLKKCTHCILENPSISLNDINSIENFALDFLKYTKNNFIPITITTSKKGVINSITIEQDFDYKIQNETDLSKISQLLTKCNGKKIFLNMNSDIELKTTLSFFVNQDNIIILNPITH